MELIENGFFETGDLAPWTPCGGMALEGGITTMPDNPVFLGRHNLKLQGNDCVRLALGSVAIASGGELSLWVRWHPRGAWEHLSAAQVGSFEARVEYSDGGERALGLLNRDALFARGPRFLDPYHLSVAVDPMRYVTAVQLRCYGAEEPWYVCGVTMEGYFVGGGDAPRHGAASGMAERLARVERRLARMERLLAMALSTGPRPPKPPKLPPAARPELPTPPGH